MQQFQINNKIMLRFITFLRIIYFKYQLSIVLYI